MQVMAKYGMISAVKPSEIGFINDIRIKRKYREGKYTYVYLDKIVKKNFF